MDILPLKEYMQIALEEASLAATRGEVPVGCVIVDWSSGEILSRSSNRIEELKDVTAHAEILALREASRVSAETKLVNCDLYVTLEPCAMCAAAISMARIRRLYFGVADIKSGGVENGPCFFSQPTCHHRPEVYGGINESSAKRVLQAFFKARRKKSFK